ncbi:hypothetical protein BKA82DRAFT_377458 [Pisolithus tinctorius]|uniref:Uncharacterized protein n=1 Tax=Pisolithus tinctorius Marx 270 TaxID=870435 RepID=A0A0C3KEC1_PISTI|nr:hypothetical protein BKA82DRAFT_377458 [Pisolithus tinctorius]KIO07947.1 hypothetical protein M404DRAFT_377458 [Pisolithus tinctorius Marx 270]
MEKMAALPPMEKMTKIFQTIPNMTPRKTIGLKMGGHPHTPPKRRMRLLILNEEAAYGLMARMSIKAGARQKHANRPMQPRPRPYTYQ